MKSIMKFLEWISNKKMPIVVVLGFVPLLFFISQSKGWTSVSYKTISEILQNPVYLGLIIVAILGIRLNRTRILITALIFLGAFHAFLHPELFEKSGIGNISIRQILCVAIPIAMAFLFYSRERRMLVRISRWRILLALAPIVAMAVWLIYDPAGFNKVISFKLIKWKVLKIPQLAYLSVILFAIVAFVCEDKRIKPFVYATLISLIPLMTATHVGMTTEVKNTLNAHIALAFAVITLILLNAIFDMYWHRVYTDELTEMRNRRALDESLQKLEGTYAIAMVDIDHFKKFNDTYGHDEGDNVLRLVAAVINQVPNGDAYRYGGEEFCAVFKGINKYQAFLSVEEARKRLAEREFNIRTRKKRKLFKKKGEGEDQPAETVQVTISVGLANPDKQHPTTDTVFKLADKALYKAKEQGRNRVVIAE